MKTYVISFAAVASLLACIPSNRAAENPLPSADAVLKQVMAHAAQDEAGEREFGQTYTYTRTRITEDRDSKGKVTDREEKKDVRKPAPPPSPVKPQPARSGAPAPAATAAKGSQQLLSSTQTSPVPRGKVFDRTDFISNGDLLKRFDFKVIARETNNGRATIVLEFKPAAKQPAPASLKDRLINKAAGRLWVDEADSVLARGAFRLTEKMSIAGGLLASISSFNYEFYRERTDGGLWFTPKLHWHVEGREVIVQRNIDYNETKTDVKKVAP